MFKNILFKECIEALDSNVKILSKEESDKVWKIFKQKLPILFWGKIDWEKIDKKQIVDSPHQIIPALGQLLSKQFDQSIYVLWNDASVPIIKTNLPSVVASIDDVTCAGPDTWFLNIEEGYLVEFFHENMNDIVVGLYDFEHS